MAFMGYCSCRGRTSVGGEPSWAAFRAGDTEGFRMFSSGRFAAGDARRDVGRRAALRSLGGTRQRSVTGFLVFAIVGLAVACTPTTTTGGSGTSQVTVSAATVTVTYG